jgi:hypothetical protein
MGTSTKAVPLMYQPMIGKRPNVSRSQGITALTVSHNNIENTAKIEAEAVREQSDLPESPKQNEIVIAFLAKAAEG